MSLQGREGLGLGFGVWGLGFGVWGLGFGVWGFGIYVLPVTRVEVLYAHYAVLIVDETSEHENGVMVWGLRFGVWGLGFGVWGLGLRVWRTCPSSR